MRISTKGRYGLRVMLELSLREGHGPVMMSAIAENQDLSRKYLHNLLTSLKAAGLVRSVRGAGGGYVLARPPVKILVSDVVRALEGSFSPVDCLDDSTLCDRSSSCVTREVWQKLGNAMEEVLSGINIEHLCNLQKERNSDHLMYYI